jgi:hypothetical protein
MMNWRLLWFEKFLDLIYKASFGKPFTIDLPIMKFNAKQRRKLSSYAGIIRRHSTELLMNYNDDNGLYPKYLFCYNSAIQK